MEIGNLPEKEFSVMIVEMIPEFGKRTGRHRLRRYKKIFNKKQEDLKEQR